MSIQLPRELVERTLTRHPLPIADAVAGLEAADSLYERRDRVVEVFRAVVRTMAGLTLAARVQYGPGPRPGATAAGAAETLRRMRQRGLTDGQWVGMVRELLRPWRVAAEAHPLPPLVEAFFERRATLPPLLDALLKMRRTETVAHGATGGEASIHQILERRVPQLASLLSALDPLWSDRRLVLPLAMPMPDDATAQRAWLLAGCTPPRGRWRRVDLAPEARLTPGRAVLVDSGGRPCVDLYPIVLVDRPSPEAFEECFFLERGVRDGARYLAIPSMAERSEKRIWEVLGETLIGEGDAPEAEAAAGLDRPYRGLMSFGPEHTALFHGRERLTESLVNRLRRHPWVTVTGPSGSGKSSLLHAGVLPRLRDARVLTMRPGADPAAALATTLARLVGDRDSVMELMGEAPAGLADMVARWCRDTDARLVIMVDQGEEAIALCEDAHRRDSFSRALSALARDSSERVHVLFCLREDFFGRLAALDGLHGLYSRQVEVVQTPDHKALARTLRGPAEHFGFEFEPGVVEEMVAAVAGEPAALALLQFAADRMWDSRDRTWRRLTRASCRALGGVAGALAEHAERVVGELSRAQTEAARTMLLRLVTAEGTRSVAERRELLESGRDTRVTAAVLDRLIAERLLTSREATRPGAEATIEIAHEALIERWGRLGVWRSEDRAGQRLLLSLRAAAREWSARGRPRDLLWRGELLDEYRFWRQRSSARLTEAEREFASASVADGARRARLRRLFTAAAFVLVSVFAAFMWTQWRTAQREKQTAQAERQTAERRQEELTRATLLSSARREISESRHPVAAAYLRAVVAAEQAAGLREDGGTVGLKLLRRHARRAAMVRVLPGYGSGQFSSDGRLFVASAAGAPTASVWRVSGWEVVRSVTDPACRGELAEARLSLDGGRLLTRCRSTGAGGAAEPEAALEATIWNLQNGAMIAHVPSFKIRGREQAAVPDPALRRHAVPAGHAVELREAVTQRAERSIGLLDCESLQTLLTAPFGFSPDGRLVVVSCGELSVYATDTGERALRIEMEDTGHYGWSFSSDSSHLLANEAWNSSIWDVAKKKKLRHTGVPFNDATALLSPSGHLYAVAEEGAGAPVEIRRSASGDLVTRFSDPAGAVAFLPDESGVYFLSDSFAPFHGLGGRTARDAVEADGMLTFAPDGNLFATRLAREGEPPQIVIWKPHVQTLHHQATPERATSLGFEPKLSPDGRTLVTRDGSSYVAYDLDGSSKQHRFGSVGEDAVGYFLVRSREHRRTWLVAEHGVRLKRFEVWDVGTGRLHGRFSAIGPWGGVSFAPTGGVFIAAGDHAGQKGVYTLRLWDLETLEPLRSLGEHHTSLSLRGGHAFSGDGKRWALSPSVSSTSDAPVSALVWELEGGEVVYAFPAGITEGRNRGWIDALSLSGDGRRLAGIRSSGTIEVHDVDGGRLLWRKPLEHFAAVALAGATLLSADGESLALFSGAMRPDETGEVQLIDVGSGRIRRRIVTDVVLPRVRADPPTVLFSADWGVLASGTTGGRLRIWHVDSGQLLLEESVASVFHLATDGSTVTTFRYGWELGYETREAEPSSHAVSAVLRQAVPPLPIEDLLRETGRQSSFRVCRDTLEAVRVSRAPPEDSIWAPEPDCAPARSGE